MKIHKKDLDLKNKKFGNWLVLEKIDDFYWQCKCDCGNIKNVYYANLLNEKSTKCASCAKKESNMKRIMSRIGERYSRLEIIDFDKISKNGTYYICKCDCGNVKSISFNAMSKGEVKSCGCLKEEMDNNRRDKLIENNKIMREKHFVEDTSLHALTQKISKNNTTGIKGVSRTRNGKYRAYIKFQGTNKHLGTFETLEDAAEARKIAEEKIYTPFLEKYKK